MRKQYGLTAQGEALPKFSRTGLPDTVRHDTISPVATLDKWRHGWWIRHPQAVTKPRTIRTSSPVSGSLPGIYPVLGAWVGSQRKRPGCALSVGRCLAATRSASVKITEALPMIYTFLIQHSRTCRLAELRRIRTVSTVAHTEAEARAHLAGLPLVFLSRTPSKGVAA